MTKYSSVGWSALFAVCVGIFHTGAYAVTPSHLYDLNGTYNDAFGGPAITPNGGVLGPSDYSFAANQGLSLSGALPSSVYTIDTTFSFADVTGYRKILDFKNLTSDTGLYNLANALVFYNVATGPNGAFTANQMARVTLTRDSLGLVNGYVNGIVQFSFTDSSDLAVFSAANTIGNFFMDDSVTRGGESSAGVVDYIAVYDTALSSADVLTLSPTGPIPEPEIYAMMAAGLGLFGLIARRRREKAFAS